MTDIIPFGKYKGQEIEQVRMRDPQYLQWLTQQAWFQEKFAPVYQVVINNFAPPSEDTPAHNAMQVRFLEFEYRAAFERAAGLFDAPARLRLMDEYERRKGQALQQPAFYQRSSIRNGRSYIWLNERFAEHRDKVRNRWALRRQLREQPSASVIIDKPTFEAASDVLFNVRVVIGSDTISVIREYRLAVEIKPCMGDDYPAVLRQIKRQQATARTGHTFISHWFLLLDEFGSSSVTLDQVRQIFAADNIRIVLAADVREQMLLQE